MEGFVTIGRGSLLLTLLTVILLGAALGWAVGQLVMMVRRPAVVAPRLCTKPHCDDFEQLGQWLGRRDFSLITNEQLHELRQKAKTYEAKPQPLRTPMVLTPEQEEKVRRIFERDSRPTWPGGEPVDI